MTTDYDRISADDLSCQTEDRLDHTEGEQTTETVKGRAKRTMVAVEVGGIVDPTTGMQNGGAGADRFVLNLNGTGTTTVTDFDSSEGDRVRVDTSAGNETSLRELGLAVQNDNGNAQIVNANDANEIYMILNITSHQDVIDNFSSYFEIV